MRFSVAIMSALALSTATAQAQDNAARFSWFTLEEPLPSPAPQAGEFSNPILPGFYPDPSIERVGDEFYLVNSSFSWFPGIPVWRSRDLVSWEQIGNAIDRPSQLDFSDLGMSRGVFAPAISHDGKRFYIVNTCVDCGGNYVITATDPAGPWSDPVWLPAVGGIDPSLFFDDDGRAWIVNNDLPPGEPQWEGHRAIWLHPFDPVTLSTSGPPRLLVDGGVDRLQKPIWIEGPHLFKHEGRYYLTAAEGGTSVDHSQVIFRADSIDGPFEPAPPSINPILTQRDLNPERAEPITSAGHADFVTLADGSWWAVFLATRPYGGNMYNTGRETFLLPVKWVDGWPVILPKGEAIPTHLPKPNIAAEHHVAPGTSPAIRIHFDKRVLGPVWLTMRSGNQPRYAITDDMLRLTPGPGIGTHGHPHFVALRQRQAKGQVSTEIHFKPDEGQRAGIAAVQDDDWHITLSITRRSGKNYVELRQRAGPHDAADGRIVAARQIAASDKPLRLTIDYDAASYRARFAIGAGAWVTLGEADGTILSTERAGGFTGAMLGLFASSASP